MVEATAPATIKPFNFTEWAEKRDSITADDLPRLKATIDAIGPTLQAHAAENQTGLRLLAAFVMRCAVPLGPPEYVLRTAQIARVPIRFELQMQPTAAGMKLAVVDKNPKKIVVAPADTKIVQGKF